MNKFLIICLIVIVENEDFYFHLVSFKKIILLISSITYSFVNLLGEVIYGFVYFMYRNMFPFQLIHVYNFLFYTSYIISYFYISGSFIS